MPSPPPAAWPAARLPTLSGERLRLRWLVPDDADALFEVFSDPLATRYWTDAAFTSRDDASIYLEAAHSGCDRGDLQQWGVTTADGDQLIGTCALCQVDPVQARAGFCLIIGRAHWGKRYGREAASLLLTHAFAGLGLRRIEADVDPRNQHALETLESLGFKREGYLRQRWQVNGQTHDSILLGLLQHEHPHHG